MASDKIAEGYAFMHYSDENDKEIAQTAHRDGQTYAEARWLDYIKNTNGQLGQIWAILLEKKIIEEDMKSHDSH